MIPDTDLSIRIPQELAAQKGVDPAVLSPPVGDVIDLEALERTVTTAASGSPSTTTTVSFEYETLTVTVEAADRIDVTVEPTVTHRPRSPNPSAAD